MVLELSHSLLLHKELSVAAERIAGYVGRAGLELPYIDGLAGLVNVNVRDFVTAYTKSSALETTPEVQGADSFRDRKYKAFRTAVQLRSYDDDSETARQATYLMDFIKKHNASLWNLGMSEQTAMITVFFSNYKKDEKAQAAVAAIGLNKELEEVRSSQEEFELTLDKRSKEASQKEDPLVKESRKKLVNNLQALLINLGVAENLNEEGELKDKLNELIKMVNDLISTTMATARARITRGSNGNEEVATQPESANL